MKYILMKAHTNSEWDSVNIGLLRVNDRFISRLINCYELLKNPLLVEIDELVINSDMIDFYIDEVESIEEITGKTDIVGEVIELTESQVEGLSMPESSLRGGSIKISRFGVTFSTYGKHTGEEFWCDISIDALNNAI